MKAATQRIAARYRADAQGATAAGKARVWRAATSIAAASANYALSEDASRPAVVWTVNAPHRWFGISLPGSGFGIDNPDNVYQGFSVVGGKHYLLRGKMPKGGPVQLHLEVRDSIPGMGEMLVEGGRQLATIQSEQMAFDPDGSFVIAVDGDPAGSGRNHLAIPGSGIVTVQIRQLLTDWAKQKPIEMQLEPVDPLPPAPPRDIPALARRSAEILDKIGPYWLDYDNRFVFSRPANVFGAPRLRPGGRGVSCSGHFDLRDDEALVVTVDSLGARSRGFQTTDPWGVAYDYDRRTSSLNATQAVPNADGTFTYIIAARDPGYANWLDTGGFGSGIATLRWQVLGDNPDVTHAIRKVEKVPLAGLPELLGSPPRWTKADRRRQQQDRAKAYAVRLGR